MKHRSYIVIAILLVSLSLHAQSYALDILEGRKKIEIPFTYRQGFLIVDFRMQYLLPLKFIFDTGSQNTIIFDKRITDQINTKYAKEIVIMGADLSQHIEAFIARNIHLSFKLNSVGAQRDIIVLKEDVVRISQLVGEEIHGIIGANYFKGLIVEIDYHRNKIIFHDPNHFNSSKYHKYEKLPLTIIRTKPYIKCQSYTDEYNSDTLNFLLDTGASISILLQSTSSNAIAIPENAIEGTLGNGLSGPIMGYVGIIDSFNLSENITFNNTLSYFQNFDSINLDSTYVYRDGIIGNTLLRKFDIVIDYFNGYVYLKPNKYFKNKIAYDKSGLTIIASGKNLREFIVLSVIKGSPAYRAGVQKGDRITKIGWRPNLFLSLKNISKTLTNEKDKIIEMTIKRDGKKIKKSFQLEDLIK